MSSLNNNASLESALVEVDYDSRIKEIYSRLASLDDRPLKDLTEIGRRNASRRAIHTDVELLAMDLEDKVGISEKPDPKSKLGRAFAELDQIKERLVLETMPPATGLEAIFMYVRLVAFLCWFFVGAFFLFLATPLRWLHPVLRQMGVQNNYLPVDLLQWLYVAGGLAVSGVQSRGEGQSWLKEPQLTTSAVIMSTHGSNLDPFILLAHSPIVAKLVGKKEVFMIPVAGWMARWTIGAIPINRGNRQQAIDSLNFASYTVDRWGRSIGIFPEGTRSKTGQILHFKKGPFYLQEACNVPIIPVVIFGAYDLWPRRNIFSSSGKVVIRYLPKFLPDPAKSRDENRRNLRRVMLKEAANNNPVDAGTPADFQARLCNIAAVCLAVASAYWTWLFFVYTCSLIMEVFALGTFQMTLLLCAIVVAGNVLMYFTG